MKADFTINPHTPIQNIRLISAYESCGAELENPLISLHYRMVLVLEGDGWLVYRDIPTSLRQGDISWIFPGSRAFYFPSKPGSWTTLTFIFDGDGCLGLTSALSVTSDTPHAPGEAGEDVMRLAGKVRAALREDSVFHFRVVALFFMMLSSLIGGIAATPASEGSDTASSVERAIFYIEQNYHNHIDVDMVCASVNYSRSYFSRTFKRTTGMAIPEYINSVRIKRAQYLIANTDLRFMDIAKSVGFNDPYYFSRSFKQFAGISPKAYARSIGAREGRTV